MIQDLSKVCATCHYYNERTGVCLLHLMLGHRPIVVHSLHSCGGWRKK